MYTLVLNSGSSSLKYKLFKGDEVVADGLVERIGEKGSEITTHQQALIQVIDDLITGDDVDITHIDDIDVVGHRVVHGGEVFVEPTMIDETVVEHLKDLYTLAPLHNPANVAGIEAISEMTSEVPQVAVFDTAFHASLPKHAYTYAIPYSLYEDHKVRRYGFHGTSHKYVAMQAADELNKPLEKLKIITCHLGNGCSVAAIHNGKSVDTTMGFTPLEGLAMGTRSGTLDPSIPLHLISEHGMSPAEVDTLLNKQSGLLGISGISNDLRELLESDEPRARLAIEVFAYTVKKYIGAYLAVLGGAHAIVFTGGIGQNSSYMRDKIMEGVVEMLADKPEVMVIKTDEELMIAKEARDLVKSK